MKHTHKLKKKSARLFENVFNCISMDNLNIKEHFCLFLAQDVQQNGSVFKRALALY